MDLLRNIMGFLEEHKKLVIIVLIVGIIGTIGYVSVQEKKAAQAKKEADKKTEEMLKQTNKGGDESDNMLMKMQKDLEASYGKHPKGFIWDVDGTLLSLGDKKMSAEDVVQAFCKGVSNLDIDTMQRYSRGSSVVETYSGYFNEKNKNTDYTDQFLRKMYKNCMKSVQVKSIENSGVFADNKKVFTVKCEMLDLTNKDFWRQDTDEIFDNLSAYDSGESDTTKADIYLYNYINKYYESADASTREVSLDITVQKYPDLDSGWLVSVDTDLNNAFQYKDGKLVVSYIREQHRDNVRNNIKEK